MKLTIEKLKENDKSLIAAWQYGEEHSRFNYALQEGGWIDTYCSSGSSHCFTAKEGDIIIGVFFFIIDNENEFRILINPDLLGKGYGKLLVKKALGIGFGELNCKDILLIVRKTHPIAISLYEKLGFNITGETEELVDHQQVLFYKMTKGNETAENV